MQLPWTSVRLDFTNFSVPDDSQIAIEIANEHPSIRQAIAQRIISENGQQQSLQGYLQTQGLQLVPTQLFEEDFSTFPPHGFDPQQTYSWIFMQPWYSSSQLSRT